MLNVIKHLRGDSSNALGEDVDEAGVHAVRLRHIRRIEMSAPRRLTVLKGRHATCRCWDGPGNLPHSVAILAKDAFMKTFKVWGVKLELLEPHGRFQLYALYDDEAERPVFLVKDLNTMSLKLNPKCKERPRSLIIYSGEQLRLVSTRDDSPRILQRVD